MLVLLLNLLLLGGLSWWGYRHWRLSPLTKAYWPALLLKLLCGCGVVALYLHYYGYGDILWFQRDAARLASTFWVDPAAYWAELSDIGFFYGPHRFMGWDRNLFYIRLLSLPSLLTGNNIWLLSLWLSMATFGATFWLAHRLALHYPGSGGAAAVAFLFWPSVVFWSGSLLKEGPAMGAMAVLVAGAFPLISGKGGNRLLHYGLMLAGAWLLWRIKYYFALPLFGVLAVLMLMGWLERRRYPYQKVLLIGGLALLLIGGVLSQLHPNFYPSRFLEVLFWNYEAMVELSEPGRHLQFRGLEPTPWSVLHHSPKALAGGLLMPLPLLPPLLEPAYLLAGLENLVLLGLIVASLLKLYRRRKGVQLPPQALVLCGYVCLMACALAIASPNLGSLLRYRTAYLPFAVFLVLYWLFPLPWRRKSTP